MVPSNLNLSIRRRVHKSLPPGDSVTLHPLSWKTIHFASTLKQGAYGVFLEQGQTNRKTALCDREHASGRRLEIFESKPFLSREIEIRNHANFTLLL
jgi:hypothetical protein